jgi:hypothetical protein
MNSTVGSVGGNALANSGAHGSAELRAGRYSRLALPRNEAGCARLYHTHLLVHEHARARAHLRAWRTSTDLRPLTNMPTNTRDTPARTHRQTSARSRTRPHTSRMDAHTHAHNHTHTHTRVRAHINTRVRASVHTHKTVRTHTLSSAYTRTHTHLHSLTHTLTH